MSAPITVYVIDGDESVRRAMQRLMKASGYQSVCMGRIEDLLERDMPSTDAVLLIDARTARQFEGSLHEQLQAHGLSLPVIFLTDCDTEPARREAKHMGAAGYFRKPVDEHALFDAIAFAVQRNSSQKSEEQPVFS